MRIVSPRPHQVYTLLLKRSPHITRSSRFGPSYQGMTTDMASKLSMQSTYKMLSGCEMPVLGFGVYQTPADVTESVTLHAFKCGYRHVDSARVYRNEQPCADAIRASGLPREQIFFTSKIPPRDMGYERAKKAISSTLSQTDLAYVDLYLIHAPYGGHEARLGSWRALVEAQQSGKIRSIGVSNYGVHHLDELESYIKAENSRQPNSGGVLSVGQWELHPWLPREDIVSWCRDRGVVVQAYSPLVRGERGGEKVLKEIGAKHGKSWAQVLLRWSLQRGFVPLPKSVTESRIEENAGCFGWKLDQEDMGRLEFKGAYEPCTWDPTVSRD